MPKAVKWYRYYCYAVSAFNLGLAAVSLAFVLFHRELANSLVAPGVVLAAGLVCGPLALFLAAANVWLPHAKRLKTPWELHMTNIVVGLGTCVLTPLAIPMLVLWMHPDVKAYYDHNAKGSAQS